MSQRAIDSPEIIYDTDYPELPPEGPPPPVFTAEEVAEEQAKIDAVIAAVRGEKPPVDAKTDHNGDDNAS